MARENGRNAETGNVAAAGRELIYTSASFSGQSDFASQKSCICAVAHITKSACPTAAKKRLLPHSAAPQSMPPPLFRVSRKQRYNTLDFAKQNRVPTGMLRAPIGNPAAKRCSLCNPSFSSQVHIQTAKGSLSSLLRKCKRRSVPMRNGPPFLRQPQFYHRARNGKIKIDGDAIRGYTVIASFDEI